MSSSAAILTKSFRNHLKALKKATIVDPRTRNVILFPGPKNVYVGMADGVLCNKQAEDVFSKANNFLNFDLLKLCLDGPVDELRTLVNSHLAAFVTSHALLEKMRDEEPNEIKFCSATSGVDVGLINSLLLANCVSFQEALDFVKLRAKAIQETSKLVPSGKVLLYPKPATRIDRVCEAARKHCIRNGLHPDLAVCCVTTHLHSRVIEIGGHQEALNYLANEGLRLFEFRRISFVPNELGLNTQLMLPVSEYIDQLLKNNHLNIKEPSEISVYSTVSGMQIRTVDQIKLSLVRQVRQSLKLEQTLHTLYDRKRDIPQPKSLIIWDRALRASIGQINRLAKENSKVVGK